MDLELIQIEPQTALSVFTTPGGLDPFLDRVRQEIDRFEPDMSSAKGRAEIKSFAHKVVKFKTRVEGIGKALADEQKDVPKKIDAARKYARDKLDAWAEEVRKPLTDWEEAEAKRVAAHEKAIMRLDQLADMGRQNIPADDLRRGLAEAEAVVVGPACQEYEAAYAKAKDAAVTALNAGIAAREKYEAEQAELAELRRQAEERAKKDREEQIAREAAEKVKREAEEKAAADVRRAEEAAQREREAAEARERDLKRAAEDAERRAAEAVEAERRRLEQEKAVEEAMAKRREEDKAHRAKINREALQALVKGGVPEEAAKAALILIATRQVPHVYLEY